ncbi:hypothetical protein EYF80_037188 [Liparis tanakae]|uniref:Uncharacterized protein n=1 Tax=Liparis tanakae TaxID=230148 RepID=A0A4Z2GH34_9TELE|nr:hypothetical protein EYF80_037188 [Liparis tanakae]
MLPSSHWLAVPSILDAYWTRGLCQTHAIGSREPPAPIGRNRHRKEPHEESEVEGAIGVKQGTRLGNQTNNLSITSCLRVLSNAGLGSMKECSDSIACFLLLLFVLTVFPH